MTIQNYLKTNHTAATAKTYEREINIFLEAVPQAQEANYQDIISYITLKRKEQKPNSIHRILHSIKKYYNYLVYKEIRQDNPAQFIQLKDHKNKQVLLQKRILEQAEIQQLWQFFVNKNHFYKQLKNRNLCMLGLLLFQGLRVGEICRMTLEDIDLKTNQIHIKKSTTTTARTLALEPCQILPFYQYLSQERSLFLTPKTPFNILFISKLGNIEKGEAIHHLTETARHLSPEKIINPKTIRMSVITGQFRQGKSLQEVQYFAGHRYPSSTERYKTSDLEALQDSILKHHPLQ